MFDLAEVFDIETDGLYPSKIHCVSVRKTSGDIKTTPKYENITSFFGKAQVLVGHDIHRYDIRHVQRLLDISVDAKFIDTLALSWYLYPERNKHGLADWGEYFGIPKPVVEDWEDQPLEVYINRCEEDVKINTKLWNKIKKDLLAIYGTEEEAWRLIDYLSFKMSCAALQEENKWKLDVDTCKSSLEMLLGELEKATEGLFHIMPRVSTRAKRKPPAKPYKKDGSISATGERWKELTEERNLPFTYKKDIEVITGYKDPNPGSHEQIKAWLYDMGWKPETFKYDRNKDTNEIRKIPQINLKDGKGICPSIKKLYKKEPKLELLDGLSILNHRKSTLEGFLKNVDQDEYVQAKIQGLTNTLRFKHTVIVNLPGVSKAWGKEMRECLIAPDGYELCGSDMSSLEDRTKQHYMWPHDPDYVTEMNTEGFDPHLDIGVRAEMLTQDQADSYDPKDKTMYQIRHDAKQVNYSCTYGVTPAGIVRNTGMKLSVATKLHQTYWKRNWALDAIADECEVKTVKGKKWLYNPVSKLWYNLRYEKDRFSTLNQGTGTYCFDIWVKHILSKREQLTGQFHDEVILCVKKGHRDKAKGLLKWAIEEANKELSLNRELDVDVQFGDSYDQIH